METIAAPLAHLEGLEVNAKYTIGKCLAEGERQAVYDTLFDGRPAIIKLCLPEGSRDASDLLAGFSAAKSLVHPHLITVYDFGQATVSNTSVLFIVTERADESLGPVLRERTLDDQEMRDLLNGVLPALGYLHSKGYIHGHILPSNVLACGDTVKLSADRLRSLHGSPGVVAPPGLHDAPETGKGVFTPAADVWSLSVLTLEALTGSPLESSVGQLRAPFRQIVEGGLNRDPEQRWSVRKIAETLPGAEHPEEPHTPRQPPATSLALPSFALRPPDREDDEPRYRKLVGKAVGGALAAAALCGLLIWNAHRNPPAPPAPAPVSAAESVKQDTPPLSYAQAAEPAGWAVVGAAFRKQADAARRAAEIQKQHPALHARVYPADPKAKRFLVIFAAGMTEAQAKRQLDRARRSGASRGTYITHLQ
jgi:hypothetical protein